MAVIANVSFVEPQVGAAICYTSMSSPVGELLFIGDGSVLTHLSMEGVGPVPAMGDRWISDSGAFADARRQLTEYFAGERHGFDLDLAPSGTNFRMRVWRALCDIPVGTTTSYGEIATAIGNPKASRAVGMANHFNPISIIIPCHRVIGADGSLTGYGGGLDRKALLLDLERRLHREPLRAQSA